jgi:hypothetical protein
MEMTNFSNSELVELNFNEMALVDGGIENLHWGWYLVSPVGALVVDYLIDKYNKGCGCH